MNYKIIYKNLYEKAKDRNLEKSKGLESHHFVPRSLYYTKYKQEIMDILNIQFKNSDDEINCFRLTLREHYIAHLILFKIYPDLTEIMFGLNQVMNRYDSSKKYESFRIKLSEQLSEQNKGFVMCININNPEENLRVTKEEFESNNDLVGINYFSNCNSKEYKCTHCDRIIKGGANFKQHNLYFCTEQQTSKSKKYEHNYECPFNCGMKSTQNMITKHEKTCELNPNKKESRTHNMTKSSCKFCGKEGSTNSINRHEKYDCELNINIIQRKKTEQVNCKKCNKLFNARGIYNHEKSCRF